MVERVSKWPWGKIAFGLTALLCIAFAVGFNYLITDVANAKADARADATRKVAAAAVAQAHANYEAAAQARARASIGSCGEYNLQQDRARGAGVGLVVTALTSVAELQGRVNDPAVIRSIAVIAHTVGVEQASSFPHRGCDPNSIDRYLKQPVGTTRLALAMKLPQPKGAVAP